MGREQGFLRYQRVDNPVVPEKDRIRSFKEFHGSLPDGVRQEQAGRCMDCGVPFCQFGADLLGMTSGCPLHNLIPEINDLVSRGSYEEAYRRLTLTHSFPEFTGRVCPALCEKACTCGLHDAPVSTKENELAVIEEAFLRGYAHEPVPLVRTGKRVAIIGSGPSGLAAAQLLNRRGHTVTVYERHDRPGGLLRYGIPNMKLDKGIIDRRISLLEEAGVSFVCNADVGKEVSAEDLRKEYEAVMLACGASNPRNIEAPGRDAGGICYAVDFLSSVTKWLLDHSMNGESPFDPRGEDVVSVLKDKTAVSALKGEDAVSVLGAEETAIVKENKPAGEKEPLSEAPRQSYIGCTNPMDLVRGKNVVVIGGGDTGNDCVGTAIRLGAASVTQLEMMPKPPEERREDNPWPQWPRVLKTDYGQEEAIYCYGEDPRLYQTTVKEFHKGEDGRISEVTLVRLESRTDPESGRRIMVPLEGSEKRIPAQLVLIAAGFLGSQSYVTEAFGVERDGRTNVLTLPGHYETSQPGIFTAGDMHRGQSLVVWAIREGREAAKAVDAYLMGYTGL